MEMERQVQDFLRDSAMAGKIEVRPDVVLHRTNLSPGDLAAIRRRGAYGPVPERERVCELQVNGITLAQGKIIRRGGEYYFKATRAGVEKKKKKEDKA